jgi:hypothetical protein
LVAEAIYAAYNYLTGHSEPARGWRGATFRDDIPTISAADSIIPLASLPVITGVSPGILIPGDGSS